MRAEFSTLRSELLRLAVVAALAPHPVQMHRQLPRHRYFGDLPSTRERTDRATPGDCAPCLLRTPIVTWLMDAGPRL